MKMKNMIRLFTSLTTVFLIFSCNNSNETKQLSDTLKITHPESDTIRMNPLIDVEEIKIGEQVWATKNLAVTKFMNGENIPQAKTNEEWEKAGLQAQPAWCYYQNDSANGKIYGKLYNWYAVNDKRGLAPRGWHVPEDKEWTELIVFLGGEAAAGIKMKSTTGWNNPGNGNNSSGFNALPGGYRFKNGVFNAAGYFASWWSATESYTYSAWFRSIRYDDEGIYRNNFGKQDGYAIRCLKN